MNQPPSEKRASEPSAPPAASDPASAAQHMNSFAFELLPQLDAQKNQAFSPLSLAVVLQMLSEGARASSLESLTRTLHLAPGDAAALAEHLRMLSEKVKQQGHELAVANRMFVQKSFTVEQAFNDALRTRYGAAAQELDFSGQPAESTKLINAWAKSETRGRIDPLLGAPLEPLTRAVLANAVYLKAQWAAKFDPAQTKPLPFKVQGKREVKVPTMQRTGTYKLAKAEGVTMLELPYAGESLAMDIVLPDAPDGLAAFEKSLTSERFLELVNALAPRRELKLSLPRFKLEGASIELRGPLSKLGLGVLFGEGADLSGIAGKPGDLYVSSVVQRAFVQVDEEGTEAAAATAAIVMTRSAVRPTEFHADHPFWFAIRDLESGAILFVGRVVDPR